MKEDKKFCVYMHKNKINDKVYIGITSKKTTCRWRNGKGYKGQKFDNAIKKYGWDNFEHIILYENLLEQDSYDKEVELIKQYNSRDDKFGYNVSIGGMSIVDYSEEGLEKLRQRTSGGNNPMAVKVYFDGVEYETLKYFCEQNNLGTKSVSNWIKGVGGCPKEFIDKNLHFVGEDSFLRERQFEGKTKDIFCDGNIYHSVEDCSSYYGIQKSTMMKWLNKINPIPQMFYDMGLCYIGEEINSNINNNSVFCDGKIFKSQREFSRHYNVNRSISDLWFKDYELMPQNFKDMGLKKCSPDIETLTKIGISHNRDNSNTKEIYCLEINKSFKSTVKCIKYFKEELNIDLKHGGVSKVLTNLKPQYKGYHFTYNIENNKQRKENIND